ELDRRMRDFLGEESMFDEQDRRLRLRRDSATNTLSVDHSRRSTPFLPFSQDAAEAPAPGSPPEMSDAPNAGPPGGGGSPGTPPPPPPPARATDNRPQVGGVRAQPLASGDLDDLPSLEAEARRLEALARELDSRANALEQRAGELE
ncbi:MAG TPA: TetR family transcriptional regulator, partial [Myxococcaceae bacterium]|nr:TetR family transcriptional regulator [Myxococcaceae bacterium]